MNFVLFGQSKKGFGCGLKMTTQVLFVRLAGKSWCLRGGDERVVDGGQTRCQMLLTTTSRIIDR
jgi:hypothetical protein